jgi:SAM-dependent methyltransferase
MLGSIVKRKIAPSTISPTKYVSELAYWKGRYEMEKGKFKNSWYERYMLGIAGEQNHDFIKNKIIADFGCGPRGSLLWADLAQLRIGIDVNVDVYADEFKDDIISHGMIYLKSTENVIPIPSDFVDIMFTMNAIDHVDSFSAMCSEIIRVIKPGGYFYGSFNLEEQPNINEPQRLTEKLIKHHLLDHLTVTSYRLSQRGKPDDVYLPFFSDELIYEKGQVGFLWVGAQKPF